MLRIYYFIFILCISIKLLSQIRVVSTEEYPTNYTIDTTFSGTTTDIVRSMLEKTKSDAVIEVFPWERSFKFALRNANVMIFTAGKTKERERLGFHFIGPVITREFSLYAPTNKNIEVSSISDILKERLVVAGMRGDWRTKYFIEEGVDVREVNNYLTHYKMLMNGRIDMVISSDIEFAGNIKSVGYKEEDIEKVFIFKTASSYIMFSPKTSLSTIKKWEKIFYEVTNDMETYTDKWSDVLGLSLGFSREKGYYIK